MILRCTIAGLLLVLATGCTGSATRPTPSCSYVVSPIDQGVAAGGGTFAVGVVASRDNCPWNAAVDVPWIALTSGASGSTTGTIQYSVAPNAETIRLGTISLRDMGGNAAIRSVTVIQTGF